MDKNQTTSFMAACKDFFGFKPGQTLTEFRDEIKELTPADRQAIQIGLIQNGYKFETAE
jgi:hypothetical protein